MVKHEIDCCLCEKRAAKHTGRASMGCWVFLCEECFKSSAIILGFREEAVI